MAKHIKSLLNKFYTKSDVAKTCLSRLILSDYDIIIEPSAGDGSFSGLIDGCLSFDIEPDADDIIKQDFLTFNPTEYGIGNQHRVLVVGNPPFGNNSSLIFKFFKVGCDFADTIAFILPASFRKSSFQDRVPLNFHLNGEWGIPKNSFLLDGKTFDVPCVFQIWVKRGDIRTKRKVLLPKTFSFVKSDGGAQISIRRVGVNAGKVFLDTDRSPQSHYFIKTDDIDGFMKRWNVIRWLHNNTVGCKSISKQEIIQNMGEI